MAGESVAGGRAGSVAGEHAGSVLEAWLEACWVVDPAMKSSPVGV